MKRSLIIVAAVVVAIAAWAAFRPERLFVNAKVNETFPTAQASTQAQVLARGAFHTNAHDTSGTATVNQLGDGSRVLRLTNFIAGVFCVTAAWITGQQAWSEYSFGVLTNTYLPIPKWWLFVFIPYGFLSGGVFFLRQAFGEAPHATAENVQ